MKRKVIRLSSMVLAIQILLSSVLPVVYAAPDGETSTVIEKPMTDEERSRKEEREAEKEQERLEKEQEEAEERQEKEEYLEYLLEELKNEKSMGEDASEDYIQELESEIADLQRELGKQVTVGTSTPGKKTGASDPMEQEEDPRGSSNNDGEEDEEFERGTGRPGGPGDEDDENEDYEEDDLSDKIKPPSSSDKNNIGDEVGDLVVSDKVYTTGGKTRVTEVYSVNNMYADCYYRPKAADIPLLGERVCKTGQFTAAYTGFFDIGWKEAAKPKGEQSRALEILGYDYLYKNESFDTSSKKYSKTLIGTRISQETAIMNIYKALGLEQYDIKMYHKRGSYSKDNSPTGSLLGRDTLIYRIRDGNSSVTDTFEGYETYVFTTRSNPILYMRKLQNDFNISIESDKSAVMTLEDFIIMCYKMMSFYGEPVLSKQETNQLLQVYGAEVPQGMSNEFQEAWMYLKARGVLNIDNDRLNGNLTKTDMFDILMCIKDKNSRTNYKEVQLTYELNTDVVNKGYYPVTTTVTEVDEVSISDEVSYDDCTVYDYMVPINDYSRFIGSTDEEIATQFVSDNPEACNLTLPGSAYLGIVNDTYYHFIIPIDDPAQKDGYYRIETLGANDKPGAIMLFDGGGIYKFESSSGSGASRINYFKRRPFNDSEFPDYVDKERKAGTNDFDYDSWGKDTEYIYIKEEGSDSKVEPDIEDTWGIGAWEGPWVRETVLKGNWIQEESSGRWRYYYQYDEESDREYLQGAGYCIGETSSGNIADHLFMFTNDGYMLTGWYQEGNFWAYFNEDGHLIHDTTMEIDGVEYEFDQWGWWIDGEYNQPEGREDDWGYLENIEGQWVYDETRDNWWFMLNDGNYPMDTVVRISDKLYCFDQDGWMYTGWREEGDSYYWFYPKEGHMATNAVVDGGKYRVGANGRVVGKVKNSASAIIKDKLIALANSFLPMTVYADTIAQTKNSLGALVSNDSARKFRVKIYDGTVQESREEIMQKVRATGVSNPRFEQSPSSWTGTAYMTIISELNAERVASLLTFKTNADNMTLVNTQMAITQFGGTGSNDMSMLVPFEELVEAGLFSNQVNLSSDGNEIQLWGISSDTTNGNRANRHSFGEIRMNKADNTIMVGPTIYTMRPNQQLWYLAPADEELVEAYQFVDADGKPLTFATNGKGAILYVDFRVVYGWAGNEVKFYQMNTSSDSNLVGEKQLVVSVGKSTVTNNGNTETVEVKQSWVKTSGGYSTDSRWNSARIIPKYSADGHSALLAANSYQLATWALMVLNSQTGSEDLRLVTYYPKLAFSQLGVAEPSGQEGLDGLKSALPKGRKVIESSDYVCRHYKLQLQGNASKGSDCQVGKWYRDKDFGYVYIMPTPNEWNTQDGYKKWVANEWALPMCGDNNGAYQVTDMSMPAFDIGGAKYGDKRVSTNSTKMVPPIASLSRFLYKEPVMSSKTLANARATSGTSGQNTELYFFGIHRMTKDGQGKWSVTGLGTTSGTKFTIQESEVGKLQFVNPIRIYSYNYTDDTRVKEYDLYTIAPNNISYVETTGQNDTTADMEYIGGDALDTFRDFKGFTIKGLISWLDEKLALVILFAVEVMPLFLFTCSLIVFGIGLMSDFKLVKFICNKYFDPIKFLTRGAKDINTVGGMKFFLCVMCVVTGFALCANGNIIKIFQWIFEVIGTYLNMLGNIG